MANRKNVTKRSVEGAIAKGRVLLAPEEVRALLGRVPRGLENMVVSGERKLFRVVEVLGRASV